jgi:hypothetical protein
MPDLQDGVVLELNGKSFASLPLCSVEGPRIAPRRLALVLRGQRGPRRFGLPFWGLPFWGQLFGLRLFWHVYQNGRDHERSSCVERVPIGRRKVRVPLHRVGLIWGMGDRGKWRSNHVGKPPGIVGTAVTTKREMAAARQRQLRERFHILQQRESGAEDSSPLRVSHRNSE